MTQIADRFGRIDVFFVNAGVGGFVPIEDATEDYWDRVHNINLKGSFFAIQKALALMSPGSAIVLCGSVGHRKAIHGNSVYAASKAGLRALARTLGLELIGRGIRVNIVSPGPIDTPIIDRSSDHDPERAASLRQMMSDAVPMKRLGGPREVARAVLFLASDDASFITGADLPVDGGLINF
jgi:NAD(P)-dependent dehydrogenase (short-subunit alcohol dehydrogenase family)